MNIIFAAHKRKTPFNIIWINKKNINIFCLNNLVNNVTNKHNVLIGPK